MMKRRDIFGMLLSGLLLSVLSACNKDEVIESERPEITLDNATGVYTVKAGREIVISPAVAHAEGAVYSWTAEGEQLSAEAEFRHTFDTAGVVFVTFRVETSRGKDEEELRIEVFALAPPVISLALPAGGLKVLPHADYILSPDILHQEEAGFRCRWVRDGQTVSDSVSYTFRAEELGSYSLKVEASNEDGSAERAFTVEVVETLPHTVEFPRPSYLAVSTDRYTYAGRPVFLVPRLGHFDRPQFVWSVNGKVLAGENGSRLEYLPDSPGVDTVRVTVTDGGKEQVLFGNVMRSGISVTAEVLIRCEAVNEGQRRRSGSASCGKYQNRVFEYVPAPGQFINETRMAGFTGGETTAEAAASYAEKRLEEGKAVSLGGFGGYVIVGFDHSIVPSGREYDFAIEGNAYNSGFDGGSNEPGIVWVMQDVNGNGRPDEEWYELRGSETGKEGTLQDYAVTYYRPAGRGMGVQWTDSEGKRGKVNYLPESHIQDFYYPAWIPEDSYTLYGTRLSPRNAFDPATGFWANLAYDWGYADNKGRDDLDGGDVTDGSGQRNGFKIENAVYADGSPATLQYIDFVKVQVGVNAVSGTLGEISTEVASFEDLSAY